MPAIACPMCGTEYDPQHNRACSACPVGAGCHLACCPECGYTTVDPSTAPLAGWLARAWDRTAQTDHGQQGLVAIQPGERVVVLDLSRLPQGKRRRLEALGLTVGEAVEVLAQSPVTVIQAGHAQLAISSQLSRLIAVGPEAAS